MRPAVVLPSMDLERVVGGATPPDPSCEDLQSQFAWNMARTGPEYYFNRWTYLRHARWNLGGAQRAGCAWARNVPMP